MAREQQATDTIAALPESVVNYRKGMYHPHTGAGEPGDKKAVAPEKKPSTEGAKKEPGAKAKPKTYDVQAKDKIKDVAAKFGVTVADIVKVNPDKVGTTNGVLWLKANVSIIIPDKNMAIKSVESKADATIEAMAKPKPEIIPIDKKEVADKTANHVSTRVDDYVSTDKKQPK